MSLGKKKWLGLISIVLIIAVTLTPTFQFFVSIPKDIRMFESAVKEIKFALPLSANVSSSNPDVVEVNGHQDNFQQSLSESLTVVPKKEGSTTVNVKLFGVIPYKAVNLNVYKDIKVIPGGQTIGVKLKSLGIMVVGHHSIQQKNGAAISPAEKAGIRTGDIILKINGNEVNHVNDVASEIDKLKKSDEITVEILRKKEKLNVKVTPLFDEKAKAYRLGMYIRDSAAGVGTLTFYDPQSKKYGALGHVISDVDTQEPIIVKDGKILYSNVTSIDKGKSGHPGEKKATLDESQVIGNITKNTPFGIFGTMTEKPSNGIMDKPISIAFPEEVKAGPAEILTVIEGQKVEKFSVEITNVVEQKYPQTKGMIIKVTDPRLLEKTGGIVQGMSGSPIIQNGKLIGAVTHVFVNDPTTGYGSYIEWMLRDAEIIKKEKNLKAS